MHKRAKKVLSYCSWLGWRNSKIINRRNFIKLMFLPVNSKDVKQDLLLKYNITEAEWECQADRIQWKEKKRQRAIFNERGMIKTFLCLCKFGTAVKQNILGVTLLEQAAVYMLNVWHCILWFIHATCKFKFKFLLQQQQLVLYKLPQLIIEFQYPTTD